MDARKVARGAALTLVGLAMVALVLALAALSVLDRSSGSIVSSGEEREYLLYVPTSYDGAEPMPLVISMHGAMTWPALQKNVSRWNESAEANGFIVVYPAGTGRALKTWFMRGARAASSMPDVVFISELIDTLQARYNLDPTRIYANGLSNGGGMAFVLSCTLSHRIAAVGAVAAAQSLPWSWCVDDRPVPMIAFHGTADRIVPYDGGKVWMSPVPFPSVRSWTTGWGRRNRCSPDPVESVVSTDVTRLTYTDCAEDAAVVLYTVRGGGHSWPGGKPIPRWLAGTTSREIDATDLMWAFFRRYRLPGEG